MALDSIWRMLSVQVNQWQCVSYVHTLTQTLSIESIYGSIEGIKWPQKGNYYWQKQTFWGDVFFQNASYLSFISCCMFSFPQLWSPLRNPVEEVSHQTHTPLFLMMRRYWDSFLSVNEMVKWPVFFWCVFLFVKLFLRLSGEFGAKAGHSHWETEPAAPPAGPAAGPVIFASLQSEAHALSEIRGIPEVSVDEFTVPSRYPSTVTQLACFTFNWFEPYFCYRHEEDGSTAGSFMIMPEPLDPLSDQ